MKSIVIAGVRCTLNPSQLVHVSPDRLTLEIPSGWTGERLKAWKDAHRTEAIEILAWTDDSGNRLDDCGDLDDCGNSCKPE
jgi:hypothetical protein